MRFKKLRLWAVYPFAIVYIVSAYKQGLEFIPGIWFVLAGLLTRCWAAGYIKKIRVLTTSGPYSFVRNPLYVGNFLMGLGFCLFVRDVMLILIYIVLFFFFYLGTMKKEEAVLTELFKEEYINYKKRVPAFIPRIFPYIRKQPERYSLKQAHYNGELIRIVVTGILLCLIYFAAYFKENTWGRGDLLKAGLLIAGQAIVLLVTIQHRKEFVKKQDKK
ncbi:MAG: isoprenylcysteine carboxylmethyltransferase family protein [Candidatus Omnitrophica bacterium]|nr:isoprenylcysteine carboxylmethyltransferase family protein [Candidatus Omnitrophota bacterium]